MSAARPLIAPVPEQPGGLMEALLAVQAAAPKLQRDATNEHFNSKFVSLGGIVKDIGPLLTEYELVWVTLPTTGENGEPALTYRLTHVPSGEALEDTMPLMCQKPDPQGQGSAITYARRYSLTAILNLVADEDDDGNGARAPQPSGQPAAQPVARPAAQSDRPASAKQRGMLQGKASSAKLLPGDFANIILLAAGDPIRVWADEDSASRWVNRALDRLPAKHVDAVLKGIGDVADAVQS
jgi:hypothetical protein